MVYFCVTINNKQIIICLHYKLLFFLITLKKETYKLTFYISKQQNVVIFKSTESIFTL